MKKLIRNFSSSLDREEGTKELNDLIDAKIIDIGMDQSDICTEGGFAIDYKNKKGETKRIIFGFTELGIWVETVLKINKINNDTSECIFIANSLNDFIWNLFEDWSKVELFNDYDIVRGDHLILDRLNDFLETIGKKPVKGVKGWKCI